MKSDDSCLCRTYAFLLRRFLQTKVQLGASHNNQNTAFTSTAEVSAPTLTQQLSCKAGTTTDFCRRVALQTELQWKAKAKLPPKHTKRNPKQFDSHHSSDAHSPSHSFQPAWLLVPNLPLPWGNEPVPCPAAVYATKQHHFFGKGSEERGAQPGKDEQQSTAGTQCTLRVKGCALGKPKSTWQLLLQKRIGRKTQLKAQASALTAPFSLMPSRWQLEARRKLPKGATFNAKLQKDDAKEASGCSQYRLMLERKAQDAWWSYLCTHNSTGGPLHSALAWSADQTYMPVAVWIQN